MERTKIKGKKLVIIITVVLTLSIFSGCNTKKEILNTENEKTTNSLIDETWVLTYEKTQTTETEYGYDLAGRLVSEEIHYSSADYTSYDFSYDDNGNVVSKSVKTVDFYDNISFSKWNYEYDTNGNCTKILVLWLDKNAQDISEYEYDQYGNVTKEHIKYQSDDYSYEIMQTAKLTYKDNQCVQSEYTKEEINDYGSEISYFVYHYTYDLNGNLESRRYYTDIDSIDDARNPIEINGKYYELFDTTYYTYERLKDVAIESINTENNNQENQQAETTTEAPKKLSEECDKVLGVGRDNNGNIYELVATETESYSGLVIEIGVIKNNEWLVNLTSDNSLIDEDHLLYGSDLEYVTAEYIADNCFFIKRQYYKYAFGVVYNFNLDAVESLSQYVYTNEWAGPLALPCYSNTGEILISKDHYAQPNFTILDTKTMKTKEINVGYVDYFAPISEGVFAVVKKEGYSNILSFYDTNGNKVLTFPQYDVSCIDCDDNWIFIDGKCNFTLYNNNDTLYQITIDKQGNVLSSIEM